MHTALKFFIYIPFVGEGRGECNGEKGDRNSYMLI